jgi:hypothetical protein
MKPIAFTLVLALLAVAAAHADNARSVALVRAMRSDEIAVGTVKFAFLSGSLVERFGKTNSSCVKRIPYTDYTAGWARVVDSVLSAREIETSLAFFQSDAGVKHVEGLLRRLQARQGADSVLPELPGKESITPAQLAAIADFSRTDLGRKIMGKEMNLSPAAVEMGRETTEQIARKCGSK